MDPASWSVSPPLAFDPAWFADVQPLLPTGGYLEGAHLCRSTQAVLPVPCMPMPSPSICCMQSNRQQYPYHAPLSCRLHAGNAVERPDGSVGLLMRMPHMQLDGAYCIDLNHACLLSFQPSAHFGLPRARAADSVAGGPAWHPAADAGPNSSVMTDGVRQPSSHAVLPAAARRRHLHATAAQEAGRQRRRGGHASMRIAEPGPSRGRHSSRLRDQLQHRSGVGLSSGTLAFEQVVVSAEHFTHMRH